MRLFVSYARVDKPYCKQIVSTLDVHEVWYDERLHAGQKWWNEILRRLEWCDGVVYLLSSDSLKSEYCQQEISIARQAGKHIFPVIIQARVTPPASLSDYQYIDLSDGMTSESIIALLNAIYVAERDALTPQAQVVPVRTPLINLPPGSRDPALSDLSAVIAQAAQALDSGEYDRAVYLLKRSRDSGFSSRFINLDAMLKHAESALERQSYLRDAEREYVPIASLIHHESTRHIGREAFLAFRNSFPDYDPDNLAGICGLTPLISLDWCEVPGGEVKLTGEHARQRTLVEPFRMSRYPITDEQFQAFVDAPDGYQDERWWRYSSAGLEWYRTQKTPLPALNGGSEYPRVNVSWYEAMAFCEWLGLQTGLPVRLPSEAEWQRAAQGDDELLYPWGDDFDPHRCNARESKLRRLMPVTHYVDGVSPFGIYDMAGNAWEWCLDTQDDEHGQQRRAVRGGSFISSCERLQTNFSYYLNPASRFDTIGFRIVCDID